MSTPANVMPISSFEELIEYTSQVLRNEIEFAPVKFTTDTLIAPLKVDGGDWEKRMDVRHAKYMMALQEAIDSIIATNVPEKLEHDRFLIKAELKEGSSDIWPDFSGIAKLVEGMTDKQKFCSIVLAIFCAAGYATYDRHLDYVEKKSAQDTEVRKLEAHEETKRRAFEPIRQVIDSDPEQYAQYEKPVTKMASMLEEGDTIAFVGEGEVPAEEAKNIKPNRPSRTKKSITPCDGNFLLEKETYSLGEPILYLEKDGITVRAYTTFLDDDQQRALAQEIADRKLTEELPFALSLQINVEHTGKSILKGVILGIGEPRPDKEHKLLSELLT